MTPRILTWNSQSLIQIMKSQLKWCTDFGIVSIKIKYAPLWQEEHDRERSCSAASDESLEFDYLDAPTMLSNPEFIFILKNFFDFLTQTALFRLGSEKERWHNFIPLPFSLVKEWQEAQSGNVRAPLSLKLESSRPWRIPDVYNI